MAITTSTCWHSMSERKPKFKEGDIVYDAAVHKHYIIGDIFITDPVTNLIKSYKRYRFYILEDALKTGSIGVSYADGNDSRWFKVA